MRLTTLIRSGVPALAVLIAAGCSGAAGEGEASSRAATVDPARVSARSLFDHVHAICNQEYPDSEAYYALVHAETDRQTLWMEHIHNYWQPKYRFGLACLDVFGELPLSRDRTVWPIAGFTWQKEDADRAVIECVNDHGVKTPLHLVRIGDRWWISGYTFEYAQYNGFEHPSFERHARALPGIGPYIDGVAAQVRQGAYATLEEAEEAHRAAILRYSRDHPNVQGP